MIDLISPIFMGNDQVLIMTLPGVSPPAHPRRCGEAPKSVRDVIQEFAMKKIV
jgi:hypothetical protein